MSDGRSGTGEAAADPLSGVSLVVRMWRERESGFRARVLLVEGGVMAPLLETSDPDEVRAAVSRQIERIFPAE